MSFASLWLQLFLQVHRLMTSWRGALLSRAIHVRKGVKDTVQVACHLRVTTNCGGGGALFPAAAHTCLALFPNTQVNRTHLGLCCLPVPIRGARTEVAVCQSPDGAGFRTDAQYGKGMNGGMAEGRNGPHRTCRRHERGQGSQEACGGQDYSSL